MTAESAQCSEEPAQRSIARDPQIEKGFEERQASEACNGDQGKPEYANVVQRSPSETDFSEHPDE